MQRELVHIYGPLAINSFGLFIIIGLIIFSALFLSDPKRPKLISTDDYFNGLSLAIIAALIGGRSLFVITHWKTLTHWWSVFEFWVGGFSLLGAVIALLLVIPLYLKKRKVKIIGLLDLVAIYAPLLQSISRIGCFFAGCCFGLPTSLPFGVINNECGIPEYAHKPLHPTQLYSAFSLLAIFFLHYFVLQYYFKKPGQLLCSYLFLMSFERFIIDFWRADRELVTISGLEFLSIPQVVALIIANGALFMFIAITLNSYNNRR
jgi:phosphatidylglycerol:prolipoprotein diacylglycerol transferase